MSISDELLKLLPVLLGGLLAIGGGGFTQYLIYVLNRNKERKQLLRDKAERLVKALYEHSDWLSEKRNNLLYRQKDHDAPSPLDEARMLQRLYFPGLAQPMLALIQAEAPMVQFLLNQRIAQLKDLNNWLKTNDMSPYNEMYKEYLKTFHACVEKAGNILQTHIES